MMRTTLLLLLAGIVPAHAAKYAGLWLEISKQAAPAGGVTQLRVTLTEPKPIIRTRMMMEFDEAAVEGISSLAAYSENGEAIGAAVRFGNRIYIEVVSPTANFGAVEEIPLLGLSVKLRKDAPEGASGAVRILPESRFFKANGDKWYVESNEAGSFTVSGNLSIDEVQPGGGIVEAGQLVRVLGRGFQPSSVVSLDGEAVAQALFVSDNELVFRAEKALQLDQREIAVANGESQVQTVIAQLSGTEHSASAYDLLAATTPLFSPRAGKTAALGLPEAADGAFNFAGIALQNPQGNPTEVRMELVSGDGRCEGAVTVKLLGRERYTRILAELFPGVSRLAGLTLKIESRQAVQVLGLEGNLNEGTVRPLVTEMTADPLSVPAPR